MSVIRILLVRNLQGLVAVGQPDGEIFVLDCAGTATPPLTPQPSSNRPDDSESIGHIARWPAKTDSPLRSVRLTRTQGQLAWEPADLLHRDRQWRLLHLYRGAGFPHEACRRAESSHQAQAHGRDPPPPMPPDRSGDRSMHVGTGTPDRRAVYPPPSTSRRAHARSQVLRQTLRPVAQARLDRPAHPAPRPLDGLRAPRF